MSELVRIEALCAQFGEQAAKEWAAKTADLYSVSMNDPGHFASQPDWKPRFEESIQELWRFAQTGEGGGSSGHA